MKSLRRFKSHENKEVFLFINSFSYHFCLLVCGAPKMYYWGDYSNSLYSCRKNATEANLLKHKQVLENIVEESNKRNLRVPPGVYSELGYIYFRQNKNEEAIKYFALEERIYPESTVFMQRLTQAAKAKGVAARRKISCPTKISPTRWIGRMSKWKKVLYIGTRISFNSHFDSFWLWS